MSELKPCPFCGSANLGKLNGLQQYRARRTCQACGATGPESTREDEAWNTRPSPWRSLKDDPPTATDGSGPILIKGPHADCLVLWSFAAGHKGGTWVWADRDLKDSLAGYMNDEGYSLWMEVPQC